MADITGTAGPETLVGSAGNDQIYGLGGADSLVGADGDDYLNGGAGADTLNGGRGNDTYVVDDALDGDVIEGEEDYLGYYGTYSSGWDSVLSSVSWVLADKLENLSLIGAASIAATGNAANNILTGNSGNNTLLGGDGNDTLIDAAGNDQIDGGDGTDTVSYAGADAGVTVRLAILAAQVTGGAGTDTITNVENAIGSAFADVLLGDDGANYLLGNAGDDVLNGALGNDTMDGGADNDRVRLVGDAQDYRFGWRADGTLGVADTNPVAGDDYGSDALRSIETLRFDDRDFTMAPGGEFRVNTTIASSQSSAKIATLATGGFVVTWESYDPASQQFDLFAQMYDASGAQRGAELRVNKDMPGNQFDPVISALGGGGFVIAWQGVDDSGEGIWMRRFNAQGAAYGGDTLVNTYTASTQYRPSIATLDGGGFVIAWSSFGQDGDGYGVYAQRYDGTGAAQGGEIAVNQYTTSYQVYPSITATPDGGFMVGWQSYQQDGSLYGVYGRRFDAEGVATGDEYRLSGTTVGYQQEPEVAALADGGTVVVWHSIVYNAVTLVNDYDIWGQRFDAAGVALGEFRVNANATSFQYDPAITALDDGGFVVVWRSDAVQGGNYEIYARRYNAAGAAVTGDMLVNSSTAGYQSDPDVAGLPDGGFIVSWIDGSGQDGSGAGVFARRFDASNIGSQPVLQGTNGNDVMDISGDGDLVAAGGTGNDTYRVNTAGDSVRESAGQGTDTIEASATISLPNNVEHLVQLEAGGAINGSGNGLANDMTGNSAANTLFGDFGDDTLDGGAGADLMAGWYGNDTYYVDNSLDQIGNEYGYYYDYYGFDTVYSSVDWTLGYGLNDLILSGGAIAGAGNNFANRISGTAGNNSLAGGIGNDTLIGAAGSDTLDGGSGSDTASYADASAGVTIDLNNAGAQDSGGSGTETVTGIEHLIGGNQADDFTGNADSNGLAGGGGSDSLTGNDGHDTLDGGSGADTLVGGAGNDTYLVDGAGDVIQGEVDGTDLVQATVGWTLDPALENLALAGAAAINGNGNESANVISGNSAANILDGLGGDDQVSGGAGNDAIFGGEGADVIRGELGNDAQRGEAGNDTIDGGVGTDTSRYGGNAGEFRMGVSATGALVLTDLVATGVDEGVDTLRNVETLRFGDQTYTVRHGELQLNSLTAGDQQQVALAGRDDGSFVAVWETWLDGSGRIYGQRVDANGVALGPEFRVDTGVDNWSRNAPDVAAFDNGGYVVTWQSWFQDGSAWGIYAQRYSAAGVRTGDEFHVSTFATGDQKDSTVAVLADGNFVVAWQSSAQDGSGWGVYAQRYTAASVAVDAEFLVNTTTTNDQTRPEIAALADGGYVVVWNSNGQDGSSWGVYAQRYNADGEAVNASGTAAGTEFQVNTTTNDEQNTAVVTALEGGGFAVAWRTYAQDGDSWGIVARVYDANGDSVGEVPVNATTAGDQVEPSITALDDGGFVVAWSSWSQDGNAWGVYAQRFNSTGAKQGSEFRVNTFTSGTQAQSDLAQLADGGFAAGWYSDGPRDGSGTSVHAQRFDSTGTPRAVQIIGTVDANRIDLGGAGALTGVGGAGNDTYVVNDNLLDRIVEISGEGRDTIEASVDWTLQDTVEDLVLLDTGGGISGFGNSVANALTGNSASNTLGGGAGNDTIDGGGGIDQMSGGFANDIYYVSEPGEVIVEALNEGTDTVRSSIIWQLAGQTLAANVENVLLQGGADINANGNTLANTLTGNTGANSLSGAGGNDTLTGGAGADILRGGPGDDTFNADAQDTLIEELDAGIDTVRVATAFTLAASFENLVLTGAGNVNGSGNSAANQLTGNTGANQLNGSGGADTMTGAEGNDTYIVDNAGDSVVEAAAGGNDKVISTALDTTLAPQVEQLVLKLGSAARNGTGNNGANLITGNDNPNDIDGGAGADTMAGGKDDDHYEVDHAGDVVTELQGEGGNDQVRATISYTLPANVEDLVLGGVAAINATGNAAINELSGNSGANVLDGKGGVDTMSGKAGNDTYYVDQTADSVIEAASEGTDVVYAGASFVLPANVEQLRFVNPQGGSIDYDGTGNGGDNLIDGGAGNDELNGLGGNDTLRGFAGDDTLLGGDGIDSLLGGDGEDSLEGGLGVDAMIGGAGNDTYAVNNPSEAPVEATGAGVDLIELALANGQSYTMGANIEGVHLEGSNNISVVGNSLGNIMEGNSGVNTINGAAGNDFIEGGEGFDSLIGGGGNDTIYGGVHDVITGDIDTMDGGLGNDTYYVDNSLDVAGLNEQDGEEGLQGGGPGGPAAAGGSNIDTVISQVSYTLSANVENLELTGNTDLDGRGNNLDNLMTGNNGDNLLAGRDGIDLIDGGIGNDTLDGGLGDDTMGGGAGNDTYIVTAGDTILGEGSSQGADTVQSAIAWTLTNNLEMLVLTGSAAADATGNSSGNTLTGNSGANELKGLAGNDTLLGLGGIDKLVGAAGNDILTGGAGADKFQFDTGLGTGNVDQITDFVSGSDKILLDDDVFSQFNAATSTTLGAAKFFATSGSSAHDADDRIIYNTSTGALFYDQDGTGPLAGIKFATLTAHPALTAADFQIIG